MLKTVSGTLCLLILILVCEVALALNPLKEAEDRREAKAPAIQEALQKSPKFRIQAARVLGRIQNLDVVADLLTLARDTAMPVRREAYFALGQLGWVNIHSPEMINILKLGLTNKHATLRAAAVQALAKLALNQTPELMNAALEDPDPRVQQEALLGLYRYQLVARLNDLPIVGVPDPIIQKALRLVASKHSQVRQSLAYYFARVKDLRGEQQLLQLLNEASPWTRLFALQGLTKMGSQDSALKSMTKDKSYFVRVAALQSKQVDESLANDKSLHVRSAWAQNADVAQMSALGTLLKDQSPTVRGEALKSLARLSGDEAYAHILTFLKHALWMDRAAAVASANSLPLYKTEILKAGLKDSEVQVRVTALEQLSDTHEDWVDAALTEALASDELSERQTSAGLLSGRKLDLEVLMKTYKNSAGVKWVELRENLVNLVAESQSMESTRTLRTMAEDISNRVAHLAWKHLQTRGVNIPEPGTTDALSFSPYREDKYGDFPVVEIKTSKGDFTIRCFTKAAPIHVANFVGRAKAGLYDGLPWHRVVSNFVIQGGDPDGSGWGDDGYMLRAEINQIPFVRGRVGMPRGLSFDSGGVQIFINHIPTPHLDGQYTVFGQVIEGLDVVDRIEVGDKIIRARLR